MCPNGNADLTRSLIINSAVQIISQDGLCALTAGRLINQAGISKGGLYHHFRTMQEVEIEVLERLLQNVTISINAYASPTTRLEFLDHIEREFFEHFVIDSEYSRALYAYISEVANNAKVKILLRSFSDELSLNRQKQLSAVSPALSPAALSNIVQIISTMQMGLMTRFFITDDLTSLKNYWRGCRGVLAELLSIEEVHSPEEPLESFTMEMVSQAGVS